ASNPDTSAAFASGTAGGLRDLKVDAAGNLYYLAGADGTVHRIVYKVLSVSGAGRTFVGTTYTLRLTATEPPGSTVTGWTINWGDGAIQNVTGNPGTVSHVYGTGGPIYTLSATVTDQAGTYRVGGPRVEVLFPNPFQTMAALIYQAVLQRPIDAWGLAYWPAALASGLPRATMIADLMASTEYRSLLIDKLYRTYLARPADPLGLSLGLQFFQAGGTEVQYKALLLGTPEYLLTRGGGTNAGFLVALYQDVLGRALDPIGLANFGALLNSGVPRQVVAQALLGSAEADAVFVAGLYATYLHRPADAVGLGQLLSAMLRGLSQEQATVLILSTDEFIASF
ncbi:MAG TPA: DUF4214 domain-containing protein, partial [Gemmataceae bacterium]|nr:DUF4214 domain-containing protein [Gemmataceae bacterium]